MTTPVECPVCEHNRLHGWTGLRKGSHCRDCHRTWTGLREAHCTLCCAHFTTPANFDRHLTRAGCQPPAGVVDKAGAPRLVAIERASGLVWTANAPNGFRMSAANAPDVSLPTPAASPPVAVTAAA